MVASNGEHTHQTQLMYILTVSVTDDWHRLHLLTRLEQPWQLTRCPHGINTTSMSASRQILHVFAAFSCLFSISICHGSLSMLPTNNRQKLHNGRITTFKVVCCVWPISLRLITELNRSDWVTSTSPIIYPSHIWHVAVS